jgi:hypothetical protein
MLLASPAKSAAQSSVELARESASVEKVGPNGTLVHSQFGGQIFGFDIDQNGKEGVLSEAQDIGGGKVLAAVETFDQATGKILNVVQKLQSKDDFLTMGVVGTSIGLVEREHVQGIFVTKRIYDVLSPLDANQFTGIWKAPLTGTDIILGVSRIQGSPNTAILAFHNKNSFQSFVFGSNVAANTFGPIIPLTDPVFSPSDLPVMAYDGTTNQAVIVASTGAVGGPPPQIALVNLKTGKVSQFTGLPGPFPFREGFVNGVAVDAVDGVACTTTEVDFSVEFYDLKKKTGFFVVMPGATGQLQAGTDVQFDPVHKLFFVAQSVSSTAASGSSIQVFDTKGNLVKSLNGFNFSNASNVIFSHIALHPSDRTGYVDGPDAGVTEIQQFKY